MRHIKPALRRTLFLFRGGNRLTGCDDEPGARRFHLVLALMLCFAVVEEFLIVPLFAERKVAMTGLVLTLVFAALASLVFHRRGRRRAATALILSALWCVLAAYSAFNGGIHSAGNYMALGVILGAAWMLGLSPALGFAAATLAFAVVEALLEYAGHPLPVYFPGAPLALLAAECGVVVLTILPIIGFLEAERTRVSALRDSKERYTALFDRSLDCVILADLEGHLLDANQAALDLLAYRREDIAGLTMPSLLVEGQLHRLLHCFDEILVHGYQKSRSEYRLRRKDGGEVFVETQASLIHRNGKPVAIQSIARDITGRKLAEAENLKLQAQLSQAQRMEAIGRLAGGIAHDFNNLLTVINGYSNLLKQQLDESPQRKYAEQINKAGESAASLTGQLLAFSRMEATPPRPVLVNDIVAGSRDMLDPLVGERIKLKTSIEASPDEVLADPNQILLCLMNLVANARDAMPAGGQITIETGNVEIAPGDIPIGSEATPGPYVRLTVRDTGIGMDHKTRQRIFEPFFSTKEKTRGTGLGLSTVYGIVSQWQGLLKVESAPGKGSEISICLPLTSAPAYS